MRWFVSRARVLVFLRGIFLNVKSTTIARHIYRASTPLLSGAGLVLAHRNAHSPHGSFVASSAARAAAARVVRVAPATTVSKDVSS